MIHSPAPLATLAATGLGRRLLLARRMALLLPLAGLLLWLDTGHAADPAPAAANRGSLLVLAQPLWSELSPLQRESLAPLESQWNGLPLAKKRSWLSLTDKMPRMNPTERANAQARIREWAGLTPEQRRMARNNFRLAKSLDRDERVATWESYQQMTPEQQSVLRANGWTSNTAARHAGAPTGLAKEAARSIALAPTTSRPIQPPVGSKPPVVPGARTTPEPTNRASTPAKGGGVAAPLQSAD